MMRLRFVILLICFVLSGFSGLVYQTAWSLEFALIFGATDLAMVTVLAAYMAGLALGAVLIERVIDRIARPIRMYALLELGIGLFALLIPALIQAAGRVQVDVLGSDSLPASAETPANLIFYITASFLILIIPTAMMGATLPLLVRWAVRREDELATKLSGLYTANVAGAALGTLAAAFLLLPHWGLGNTILFAVAINVAIAIGAAILSKRAEPAPAVEPQTNQADGGLGQTWILPVMLLAGAVSFSWEVLWTRLLTHVLGGSTYAFAIMLAAFLVGIALGSSLSPLLAKTQQRAMTAMACMQLAIAILSLAAFAIIDFTPGWIPPANQAGSLVQGAWITGLLLLPSTTAIGATFPLAVRILANRAAATARASARVFAWNTIGAIIGAIATGYWLLPALRFANMAGLAATVSGCLALFVALASQPRRRVLGAATAIAMLLVLLLPPATPWRVLQHSPLGSGALRSPDQIAYYGVGRGATVLLTEEPTSYRLTTNGLPESSVSKAWDLPGRFLVARWLSMLPTALRPQTQSQLIIGFGAGITASELPPSVTSIHVVEIEPEVLHANRAIQRRRLKPFDDPRITVSVNDARGALRLSKQRFDAIVSQPSHPWTSAASNLFTREFFQLVADHLEQDGVFIAWMGLGFIDDDLLKILLATALDVFPNVELYRPNGSAIIIAASASPLNLVETAEAGLNLGLDQWSELGVLLPEDLLYARVLTSESAKAFSAGTEPNSDYHNHFRGRAPLAMTQPLYGPQADRLLAPFDLVTDPQKLISPGLAIRRLIRQRQSDRAGILVGNMPAGVEKQLGTALLAISRSQQRQALTRLNQALTINQGHLETRAALLRTLRPHLDRGQPPPAKLLPFYDHETVIIEAWKLQSAGDWRGVSAMDKDLATLQPRNPLYAPAVRLRAWWRSQSGNRAEASKAMDLLEPILAPLPAPVDLMLYAESATAAGDTAKAMGALEFALGFSAASASARNIAQAANTLLNNVPQTEETWSWRKNLKARINQRLTKRPPRTR